MSHHAQARPRRSGLTEARTMSHQLIMLMDKQSGTCPPPLIRRRRVCSCSVGHTSPHLCRPTAALAVHMRVHTWRL